MKKNKKLSINELKVQSFVTTVKSNEEQSILGAVGSYIDCLTGCGSPVEGICNFTNLNNCNKTERFCDLTN